MLVSLVRTRLKRRTQLKSLQFNYHNLKSFLERTSVADTLGTLSVGAVVAIFLAIFIVGCVLGLIVGVLGTHKKLKQFVVKRRPGKKMAFGKQLRSAYHLPSDTLQTHYRDLKLLFY